MDRGERGAAHLRGAGADPLCRSAGLRQRLVFRAPFPPGLVAQQRTRPDPGGGEPAHQPHPARHRGGAGADPPPAACRAAHGDARHLEPRPGRCRDRPHRLSLPAHPVRHRSEGHARHVAGIRRRIAAPVDRGGDLLRRDLLQDPASRGPAKAGAAAASAAVVGLRQRRDGAADRQPRDGRAVRRRGRPQPRPRADGAVSRGLAARRPATGRQRRRAPR